MSAVNSLPPREEPPRVLEAEDAASSEAACALQRRKPEKAGDMGSKLCGLGAAACPWVSHSQERGRFFVSSPIQPCRSWALNSPLIIGSEWEGLHFWTQMAGRRRATLTRVNCNHTVSSLKKQRRAQSGSALMPRLETGNWGAIPGEGKRAFFEEHEFRVFF